jgi:hypothetical protein
MRDVGEAQALSEDVLIRVTVVFHDRETFEALETRVLPALTASRTGGFGLFNAREQVSRLRGTLDINATAASGTRATLRVPVPGARVQSAKKRPR